MINTLFDYLSGLLYGNFWLGTISAFCWGVLSILLSPCHLSSIPLVIGFINSQSNLTTKKSLNLSITFAVGILLTIAVIGLITAWLGRLIGDVGSVGNYLVAAIFFVVGLYFFDVINLSWLGINIKPTKKQGYLAALILGLLFGIGLGPCTFAFMAPVLGVVFELSKVSIIKGITLLFAFAVGHCFVIVLAGTLAGKVQLYLNWSDKSGAVKIVRRVCGVLVILGGIYMIYTTF